MPVAAKSERGRAVQRACDHAFHHRAAKTRPLRRSNRRAVPFRPAHAEFRLRRPIGNRPGEANSSGLVGQCAVLDGVCGQFVKRHAQRLGRGGREPHGRPVEGDARAEIGEMRKLRIDQPADLHALPFARDQQVIGGGEAGDALGQALGEDLRVGGVGGLPGDRLDHRQQVVGAMIELGQQQPDMLLRLLALGDVDIDAAVANRLAGTVAHRAATTEDPAQRAIDRPDDAILDFVGIEAAVERLPEALAHPRGIVGMAHGANDVVGHRLRRNRQTHDAKEGRRGPHHIRRQVGVPDADAGRLLGQRQQLVALLQGLGEASGIVAGGSEERRVAGDLRAH